MSGDETAVLILSGLLAAWTWYGWYLPPIAVERLGAPSPGRRLVLWTPAACAVALFAVLKTVSAHDVRDDPVYLGLYMTLGAAWVGLAAKLLPYLGLSPRDDAIERGNASAATAATGALLGLTLCFAGGNIGDGPGWWVVVFAATLSTGALAGLWLLLDRFGRVNDAVTIERDRAAGARLAGFLVATGLVLGRAVAGNWVSAIATLRDFATVGGPVLGLCAVAAAIERGAAPTAERPVPPATALGTVPALAYVAIAIGYVVWLGPAR